MDQAVTADVGQACADLAAWHHPLRHLITQPDTQPTEGRTQPHSTPPWNSEAANILFDIHAGLRELEQELRYAVTGRPAHQCRRTGWSDGNTRRALDAISKLSAADQALAATAARQINAWISSILQLAAIDLEQPPRRLQAPCPRPGCGRPMLRYYPLGSRPERPQAELGCIGCAVKAELWESPASGAIIIKWSDGVITTHGITITDLGTERP